MLRPSFVNINDQLPIDNKRKLKSINFKLETFDIDYMDNLNMFFDF